LAAIGFRSLLSLAQPLTITNPLVEHRVAPVSINFAYSGLLTSLAQNASFKKSPQGVIEKCFDPAIIKDLNDKTPLSLSSNLVVDLHDFQQLRR